MGVGSRMERMLAWVVIHPIWVIVIVLAASIFSITRVVDIRTGALRLELDPSTDSMLPADSEERRFYDRIKATFDSGETLLIALVTEDVFTTDNLKRVQRISEEIEGLDQVHHVSSLATALNIRGEEGSLRVEPFFYDVPTDLAELAALRRRALTDPIYSGNLISKDGQVAVIAVYLMDIPEKELLESGFDGVVSEIARAERGDNEIWISGGPHIKAEMSRLMLADLGVTIPISWVLMSLVAYLSFRTLRGVLVPIATVQFALMWTMGLVAMLFERLNQVTIAGPPILVVVGFAYSIHILSAYYDAIRRGEDEGGRGPVFEALRTVAVPVIFTGITTAAGFFSLMTSPLPAISQFGAFAGIGVIFTTLISLTFAPALLQLMPIPEKVRLRKGPDGFDRVLERVAHFDLRYRNAILALGVPVSLLALYGMSKIEIGTDMVSSFKSDNVVRMDFERINERLEGANGFNVILGDVPEHVDFLEK